VRVLTAIYTTHGPRGVFKKAATPGALSRGENMIIDFDEIAFKEVVTRHWNYHRTCRTTLWSTTRLEGGVVQFSVAPGFREIFGGSEDGQRLWTGYSMRLSDLFAEPEVNVTEFGFRSYCEECTPTPFVGIRGTFKNCPFILMVHLQPIPETKPCEIIDTITNQTRAVKEDEL
jgi:hypothetical protein